MPAFRSVGIVAGGCPEDVSELLIAVGGPIVTVVSISIPVSEHV